MRKATPFSRCRASEVWRTNGDKRPPARGAERRQARSQEPHHVPGRYRPSTPRARRAPRIDPVARTARFGRARLSALHRGFPRAALRLHAIRSRPRVTRAGGPGVTDHPSRLSQAPGTPTLVSRGSIPGPPGSRVTSPARRNRSHPISRLSPVDAPQGRDNRNISISGTYCQGKSLYNWDNIAARPGDYLRRGSREAGFKAQLYLFGWRIVRCTLSGWRLWSPQERP
jgi:hypothetical protein